MYKRDINKRNTFGKIYLENIYKEIKNTTNPKIVVFT